MSLAYALILPIIVLGLVTSAAVAAVPTRVTLTSPSSVETGEEIPLKARLLTDGGRPVGGVRLELRQVGAVGERVMAEATTDGTGVATFVHREYTIPALTLRIVFRGNASFAEAQADRRVVVNGLGAQPAVVMSHTPSPLVKGTLFSLLATVWLTYLYSASRVAYLALAGGEGRAQSRRSHGGGRAR